MKRVLTFICFAVLLSACARASTSAPGPASATEQTSLAEIFTATPLPPTGTFTPSPIPPMETPVPTITATPIPTVESLKAIVTSDKIICRYGPGANYLYLIAFNKNTPLRLIGRAPGNSWVLVQNEPQKCWVNSEFIALREEGDSRALIPMYPDGYKIPVSPYYGPTTVLTAERNGNEIKVTWMEVIVSPGKYEDENMFPYIVEVWTCHNGEIVFDTLGSRVPFITFTDEPGCPEPSHGRVYIQEKHGYAGPAEIPWPEN
ncbi:MAG: hypothetical protein HYU84_06015 [Chloroflexi bacterium]|nr:hypothetical protein [Chloroflexota bacterium]